MGVELAFESKAPHTTPWLAIEYDVGDEPAELLTELSELGWREDDLRRLPVLDCRQEGPLLGPQGSCLFGGWLPHAAKANMPPVRRLLRRYGFDRVPWNRLTLADLL